MSRKMSCHRSYLLKITTCSRKSQGRRSLFCARARIWQFQYAFLRDLSMNSLTSGSTYIPSRSNAESASARTSAFSSAGNASLTRMASLPRSLKSPPLPFSISSNRTSIPRFSARVRSFAVNPEESTVECLRPYCYLGGCAGQGALSEPHAPFSTSPQQMSMLIIADLQATPASATGLTKAKAKRIIYHGLNRRKSS